MRVLGEHRQVHALEWDSRFLVDVGASANRPPRSASRIAAKTAGESRSGSGSQSTDGIIGA
jgi:hypothetical protein